jgi:hypothetical protein
MVSNIPHLPNAVLYTHDFCTMYYVVNINKKYAPYTVFIRKDSSVKCFPNQCWCDISMIGGRLCERAVYLGDHRISGLKYHKIPLHRTKYRLF